VNRENQRKAGNELFTQEIPLWVRDNLVLKLLDDYGLRLEIRYDYKYLNGYCDKPLIVIRGKKSMK